MKLSLSLKPKIKQGMRMGMKMSHILSIPDMEFREYLREIEEDPIFCLLKEEKVIRMKGFPKAGIAMELKEGILPDRRERSIEPLLEENKDAVEWIKGIGPEKFKRYFWENEEILSLAEIEEETGLTLFQIKAINSFIDNYEIATLTSHPKEEYKTYTKIASIEDDLTIGFFLRDMVRGVYHIDRERLAILRDRMEKKQKRLTEIIRKLEEVNARKTTIYQIIEGIIELQRKYIKTGRVADLVVLTETGLAERIGVNISSVSRAIYRRTVDTRWGERSLKFFFPSKRSKIKLILPEMEEASLVSDEKLKAKLEADYGISTSRRQITSCRNELKIPSSRKKFNPQISQIKKIV
ncbi:MAG: hypothetical protein V2A53_00665 [bacterium]